MISYYSPLDLEFNRLPKISETDELLHLKPRAYSIKRKPKESPQEAQPITDIFQFNTARIDAQIDAQINDLFYSGSI